MSIGGEPLRLVLLEDDPEDAALVLHELRRADFDPQVTRVWDEAEYLEALERGPDVILADFSLPRYDAMRALDALRERQLDVPFIIVSGTIGEETAVTAIQAGASDYLLKDRLSRLGTSIRRAMEQRKQAARCRDAEMALRKSEERFRLAAQAVTDLILEWDSVADTTECFGEPGPKLGCSEEEMPRTLRAWAAMIHPEDRDQMVGRLGAALAGERVPRQDYRVQRKDGSIRYWSEALQPIECACERPRKVLIAITDVTDRVEDQQRIAAMNGELRELSGRLMRLQDEERRRFARELHDSTAQSLTALSLSLNLTASLPELEAHGEARQMLTECAGMVEGSIREVRTMSYLLHPLLLDDVGLESALRNFVSGFEKRSGIPVTFYAAVDRERWRDDVETATFRFVQEALSNVLRHAQATKAEVRVVESTGLLTVQVSDNGRGFPAGVLGPNGAPRACGVGIAGMRERARFLGGGLTIRSAGNGSTLELKVPTHEED